MVRTGFRTRAAFAGAFSAVLLAGCGGGMPGGPPAVQPDGQAVDGTHIFLGRCILVTQEEADQEAREAAGVLAALAAAVIPQLVAKSLDGLADWLKAQGAPPPVEITRSANYSAGDIDSGRALCIQMVRGPVGSAPRDEIREDWLPGLNRVELNYVVKRARLPLAGPPSFLLEARLRRSPDGSAFALAPTYLFYPRDFGTALTASRTRGLALEARLYAATAQPSAMRTSTVVIGDFVPRPVAVRFPLPANPRERFLVEGSWFGAPSFLLASAAPASQAPAAGAAAGAAGGASPHLTGNPPPVAEPGAAGAAAAGPSRPHGVPFIVEARLVETPAANPVAAFLGSVLAAANPTIAPVLSTAAQNALIPSSAEAARLANISTRQMAEATYWSKYVVAETKYDDYCAAPQGGSVSDRNARLTASQALRAVQGEANLEADRISHPRPYPERVPVDAANLRKGCDGRG